jgi:hypothetical protein
MTFDRRRSELEARSSAPPRFTQRSTMKTILLNLTHTTCQLVVSSVQGVALSFRNSLI